MKGIGSGSDGGVEGGPGTWAAKNVKTTKNYKEVLILASSRRVTFLAAGIGRTVYFLDFSDFL